MFYARFYFYFYLYASLHLYPMLFYVQYPNICIAKTANIEKEMIRLPSMLALKKFVFKSFFGTSDIVSGLYRWMHMFQL